MRFWLGFSDIIIQVNSPKIKAVSITIVQHTNGVSKPILWCLKLWTPSSMVVFSFWTSVLTSSNVWLLFGHQRLRLECTRQACDWHFCFGGVVSHRRASRTSPLPILWGVSGYLPVVCLWALICLFSYYSSLCFLLCCWFSIWLFTIYDHRERIASIFRVERGFRGQWRLVRHFSASRKLRISPRTLQTLHDNGTLAFSKIGNKTYYRPEDVERIIRIVEDRRKEAKWQGRTIWQSAMTELITNNT